MAGKIKLNSSRMDSLYASMRQEQQRLEDAAALVSRIASGLDMDVSARAGIDASLDSLRRQLQQQAENMNQMRQLAQLSAAGICEKDEQLANEARGMVYDMRQMLNAASAASTGAAAGNSSGILMDAVIMTNVPPSWNLDSQEESGMLSGFLGMLGGNGLLQPTYPPNEGVNLTGLLTAPLHNLDLHMSAEDWEKTLQNGAFTLLGMGALGTLGTGVLGAAGFFSNTAVGSTMGTKKPLKPTTGPLIGKTELNTFQQIKQKVEKNIKKGAEKIADSVEKGTKKVAKAAGKVKDAFDDFEDKVYDKAKEVPFIGYTYNNLMTFGSIVTSDYEGILKYGKKALEAQPMQYAIEAGGDYLAACVSIGGMWHNLLTGNSVGAVSDAYGIINYSTAFWHDSTAWLTHLCGDVFQAIGDEEKAAEWYADAEAYSEADNVAGAFNLIGVEPVGDFFEGVDTVNTVYKVTEGIKSLWKSGGKIIESIDKKEWAETGKNLFELSGWKIPKDPHILLSEFFEAGSDVNKVADYKAILGNGNLLYKYATSDEGELLKTALENTTIGKPFAKLWDAFESLVEDVGENEPDIESNGGGGGGGRF